MAKKTSTKGFNGWPGRRHVTSFDRTVSPLGGDVEETPAYSPSREVTGGAPQGKGTGSRSESAKDQRRG